MDKIMFQRISGGWEYSYTRFGEQWRAFAYEMSEARNKMRRILGWDSERFDRAQFIRF